MSKEQFEHIENKFREAAENFQPPLNEEAWQKMDQLLDQEFNGNRRRPGGFWITSILLLLLLTSGIAVYHYYGNSGKKQIAANRPSKQTPINNTPRKEVNVVKAAVPAEHEVVPPPISQTPVVVDEAKKSPQATSRAQSAVSQGNDTRPSIRETTGASKRKLPAGNSTTSDAGRNDRSVKQKAEKSPSHQVKEDNGEIVNVTSVITIADKTKQKNESKGKPEVPVKDDQVVKAPPAAAAAKVVAKKAVAQQSLPVSMIMQKELENELRVNKVLSRFYITAAIASDGNAVKGSAIKNITAMYGVGVGYNISNRFSIQTGLYAGSKKYTADSAAYYHKPGYWRMVKIRKIDADCFVYNIPVSVRYNITMGMKGNFYAVAGLSSYFMQKESYYYYYSYRNNDSVRHGKEVYGENEHLMAVADFSLGYEHKFSKHVSIQAEPYLKLPLRGIGEGKVHLYSAGLMLGLKLRP